MPIKVELFSLTTQLIFMFLCPQEDSQAPILETLLLLITWRTCLPCFMVRILIQFLLLQQTVPLAADDVLLGVWLSLNHVDSVPSASFGCSKESEKKEQKREDLRKDWRSSSLNSSSASARTGLNQNYIPFIFRNNLVGNDLLIITVDTNIGMVKLWWLR